MSKPAPGSSRPLNVLWLIDHVCYDGSLHGGGRLYMNVVPEFDPLRVRVFPYFLRASPQVRELFRAAGHPARTLDVPKYDALGPLRVAQLCRQHSIDVMHLFCYAASTFGRAAGRVLGIPTVIHDFDTQVYFPYPRYLRVLDRLLARSTTRALAASGFCRDYMRDVRRVPADRLEVLYHAIPTDAVGAAADPVSRASARAAFGLRDTDTVFTCVTKLGPERGNETLLHAFAEVYARRPDARLVLAYRPTLYHRMPRGYESIPWARDPALARERLESLLARLGLGDAASLVELAGSPARVHASGDVFVAPFENPRFSSVDLVEAMAHGCPHVVTDLGEPAELVTLYAGGLKAPAGDVRALADKMLQLAEDTVLRDELARRARAGAMDLTVTSTARRLETLYASLLRRSPANADEATGVAA